MLENNSFLGAQTMMPSAWMQGRGGLVGQALSNQIPQEKRPKIQDAIEELQGAVSFHGEQLQLLYGRLAPLMSLEPGQEGSGIEANEPTCPLAASIKKYSREISQQTSLICQILRRLEI